MICSFSHNPLLLLLAAVGSIVAEKIEILMKSRKSGSRRDMVQVRIDLPISILTWVDHLKVQMGLPTRGAVVICLLRELLPDNDLDKVDEA